MAFLSALISQISFNTNENNGYLGKNLCTENSKEMGQRAYQTVQNHFYFSRFIIRNMCYFCETKPFVKCNSQN